MIKPEGKLVNVDWKKEPTPAGPPVRIRFTPEHAVELIEQAGFRIEDLDQAAPYHYKITARLKEGWQNG